MFRAAPTRSIAIAAFFAAALAVPRFMPAQTPSEQVPDQSTLPVATPPAATAAPSQVAPLHKIPTAEDIGDSLTARQRYQAAIAAYSKAPLTTAAIWNKMGIDYQMMFNSKDAMRCYKQSLKLNPRDPQVLNNLATVYASLKEYGQADRYYRKSLHNPPWFSRTSAPICWWNTSTTKVGRLISRLSPSIRKSLPITIVPPSRIHLPSRNAEP